MSNEVTNYYVQRIDIFMTDSQSLFYEPFKVKVIKDGDQTKIDFDNGSPPIGPVFDEDMFNSLEDAQRECIIRLTTLELYYLGMAEKIKSFKNSLAGKVHDNKSPSAIS